MRADVLEGGFRDTPVDAARSFRAAMEAMARPGRIRTTDVAAPPSPLSSAAGTLILTLCDPGTPIHLAGAHDTQGVREWIAFHTGAPFSGRRQAQFAVGCWQDLLPLGEYRIGTSEYPDRSATLIVEMPELTARGATLRGPGISATATLDLPDKIEFARNAALFPLGLDFFLTAGTRLAAVPRSTKVD